MLAPTWFHKALILAGILLVLVGILFLSYPRVAQSLGRSIPFEFLTTQPGRVLFGPLGSALLFYLLLSGIIWLLRR